MLDNQLLSSDWKYIADFFFNFGTVCRADFGTKRLACQDEIAFPSSHS